MNNKKLSDWLINREFYFYYFFLNINPVKFPNKLAIKYIIDVNIILAGAYLNINPDGMNTSIDIIGSNNLNPRFLPKNKHPIISSTIFISKENISGSPAIIGIIPTSTGIK